MLQEGRGKMSKKFSPGMRSYSESWCTRGTMIGSPTKKQGGGEKHNNIGIYEFVIH